MSEDFNLNYFNAAMKKVKAGTTAEEFATNYADASNAEKGSSVWKQKYEQGLKQFATIDIHKGSEGKIDDDEFKVVGLYVERLNGHSVKMPDNVDDLASYNYLMDLRGVEVSPQLPSRDDIKEQHHLKPVESMTEEEIRQELAEYKGQGFLSDGKEIADDLAVDSPKEDVLSKSDDSVPEKGNVPASEQDVGKNEVSKEEVAAIKARLLKKKSPVQKDSLGKRLDALRKELVAARNKRNLIDAGSDKIDYHIGTFNQGHLGSCAMLSQLNGLSDETLRRMIQEKTDSNGKKYYEITFPIDANSGKSVKVTEEELNNGKITISHDGESNEMSGFSKGDADVMLLEMAFYRRFGVDASEDGVDIKLANDIFTYPEEHKQHVGTSYEVTEDKIRNAVKNNEHATMTLKHTSRLPEDFSYLDSVTSAGGISTSWVFESPATRRQALESLETMLEKYSDGADVDMSKYEQMSDAELMNETFRYVSRDYGFCGALSLSNGSIIIEDHAYSLKGFDEQTGEVIIANPHHSNEDIRVPIEIAQRYFDISV